VKADRLAGDLTSLVEAWTGEVTAGVQKEDVDRFFTGLPFMDASESLRPEASGGAVGMVEADDLVAFLLAHANAAFGRPGD